MALQDLLELSNTKKKIGISEERIEAVKPILRKYIAFWREYPDLFIDFLVYGPKVITGEEFTPEEKKENEGTERNACLFGSFALLIRVYGTDACRFPVWRGPAVPRERPSTPPASPPPGGHRRSRCARPDGAPGPCRDCPSR